MGVFVGTEDVETFVDVDFHLSCLLEDALTSPMIPVEVKILMEFLTATARRYLDFAPLRYHYIKEAMTS